MPCQLPHHGDRPPIIVMCNMRTSTVHTAECSLLQIEGGARVSSRWWLGNAIQETREDRYVHLE